MIWTLDGYYHHELRFHEETKSQHGYPMTFHRDAMKHIARDLLGLETIAAQNKVPQKWFARYRADALKAIFREASIWYPNMIMGFKSATQFRPDKSAGERQRELYQAIQTAFRDKTISDILAYHLVALICSPLSSIKRGKLNPMPTGIGKTIRRKKKLQLGNSSKKRA